MKGLLTLVGTLLVLPAQAADPFEELLKRRETAFARLDETAQDALSTAQRRADELYEEALRSSRTRFIGYRDAGATRVQVRYDSGEVVIETVTPDAVEAATRVLDTLEDLTKSEGEKALPALGDLLAPTVAPEPESDPGQRRQRLAADLKAEPPKVGIPGKRWVLTVPMVADHLQRRARRYLPLIREAAARWKIEPALVLAVIHTESLFNPDAVSSSGALGLMQIMPQYAGKEVLETRGHSGSVSRKTWFEPHFNIEVGTCYLALLSGQRHYFADVPLPETRRLLVVGGYNWGPHRVLQRVLTPIPRGGLGPAETHRRLARFAPAETRAYVRDVEQRREQWGRWLEEGTG